MLLATHPRQRTARTLAAGPRTCHHFPPCPSAAAPGRHAARTVATHPEQGWSLLCNGVVLFDDNGELPPSRVPKPSGSGPLHQPEAYSSRKVLAS
jgi:hypothetical protein